ncbi:hypothetical protein VTJ49DRAFT_5000 [Mycothermus thermophilus]|uniref:Uncharacterized protein n=1 Tax=Humicola insolens TaxID=85995 RepID=A0ABR3VL38_HUMIN
MWSPSHVAGRSRVPRRYFQVPKDQRKLLDSPAAWSNVNIPPGVLEDPKPTTRNPPADKEDKEEISQATSNFSELDKAVSTLAGRVDSFCRAESPARSPSANDNASDKSQSEAEVDCDDEHASSRGSQISWSPSPSAHLRPPGQPEESNLPASSSLAPSPDHHDSPASARTLAQAPKRDFLSTSPRQLPPERDFLSSSPRRLSPTRSSPPAAVEAFACAPQLDFPPSSSPSRPPTRYIEPPARVQLLAQAPELNLPSSSLASGVDESEIPEAVRSITDQARLTVGPVFEPTPPSAQVIPCTIAEETSPIRPPELKRRRLMKPIPASCFSSPQSGGREGNSPPAGGASQPSSPVFSSSPPRLATTTRDTVQTLSEELPVVGERESSPAKQRDAVAAIPQPVAKSSNESDALPPNGPSSQVPYTAFKVAYPDYKGSLGVFLRGVMCILNLQKKKALPEFLYDDFVRVFSTDYLEYIQAVDSSQPPLKAIQFYSENVSRPLYMKGVLTKDNVAEIPAKYPEKSRTIQAVPDVSTTSARPSMSSARSTPVPPSAAVPDVPQTAETPRSTRQEPPTGSIPIASPQREAPSPSPVSIRTLPSPSPRKPAPSTTKPTVRPPPQTSRTWVDSSLPPQFESQPPPPPSLPQPKRPHPTEPPPSSSAFVPPSTAVTTVSNADSIPDIPRRQPRPRASAASSSAGRGVAPGMQFKRPHTVRTAEDVDKRAERFRMFMAKKMAEGARPSPSPTPK